MEFLNKIRLPKGAMRGSIGSILAIGIGISSCNKTPEEVYKKQESPANEELEGLDPEIDNYRKQIETLIKVNRELDEIYNSEKSYEEVADALRKKRDELSKLFNSLNQSIKDEEKLEIMEELSSQELISFLKKIIDTANNEESRRNLADFYDKPLKKSENQIDTTLLKKTVNLIFRSLNERNLSEEEREVFLVEFGNFISELTEANKAILLEAILEEYEKEEVSLDIVDILTHFDKVPVDELVTLAESSNHSISRSGLIQLSRQAKDPEAKDPEAKIALNSLLLEQLADPNKADTASWLIFIYAFPHTNPSQYNYLTDEVVNKFLELARNILLEDEKFEMSLEERGWKNAVDESIIRALGQLAYVESLKQGQKEEVANILVEIGQKRPKTKSACLDITQAFKLKPVLKPANRRLYRRLCN